MGVTFPRVELQGEGLVDCSEGAHSLCGRHMKFFIYYNLFRSRTIQPWNPSKSLFCMSGGYKEGKAIF